MGRVVAQDPALTDRVMAMAVLTLDSKEIKVITATRVVTISNPARGVSSSSSPDFKVIQSS